MLHLTCRMKSFRIYLLCIVAIIIFAGVGVYLFWSGKNKEVGLYRDPKYNFEIKLPSGFYDAGKIDGLGYSKFFVNRDIGGDFSSIQESDLQLSIVISTDESQLNNKETLKETSAIATQIASTTTRVDSQPALEQFEHLKTESGTIVCELSTYFKENGASHIIELQSEDCNAVDSERTDYDAMLSTFHYIR
jgi:hypothetical protein